ncbi:MAG TPA: L-serine ammonia-lyase, iron-sulfur-dependent subunit beta [Syntrophomonadaceae bacterium]|jgi:L-serine dehydratase|nr:L-serine ammonia-lyase, iron-sulfur-dependent subunit beta [Syntrophomonadaceae bacterium]HRX20891.1 L-serine ammonia-lyase, iron-sulfur-dependent subunit beta [Syntrophomonadaceae bacterium]
MEIGLFDVLGPIMVGPSSSHTAGAVRLGNIARKIAGPNIRQADFYLHGSFAKTHKGHGTDKALLGGVLGMAADDERIKDSFSLAEAAGIRYTFHNEDLGDVHPNSVRIVLKKDDTENCELIGSSIGGGKVMINSLNGLHVEFSGQYPTVITIHNDRPGVVANVSSVLSKHGINIAFLKVFRQLRGSEACMIIESDQPVSESVLEQLRSLPDINTVSLVDL